MVQVFMVVRCFACETFQVHQVKKSSNKWQCKICNEKQSVQKVYGQGTAGDCRQHVQKLNMQRGEREAAEQQLLKHPPEDYAAAFDEACHHGNDHSHEHPVLLTGKDSRWKLFTEPVDSNSEEESEDTSSYTTDRTEFEQTRKKKRQELKRYGSDSSKPHPLSKYARGEATTSHSHTPMHPYSCVNDEMGHVLSGIKSSGSCFVHCSSDRYHKLDDSEIHSNPHEEISCTHSVQNTISGERKTECGKVSPSVKPRNVRLSQDEKIASIRDDIGRFSKNMTAVEVIPRVSSRWSKFMNESELGEEGGEGDGGEGREGGEGEDREGVHMHMLQSKVAVAKYN